MVHIHIVPPWYHVKYVHFNTFVTYVHINTLMFILKTDEKWAWYKLFIFQTMALYQNWYSVMMRGIILLNKFVQRHFCRISTIIFISRGIICT